MSFDWMSFATGFLERTEEIQTERREEAKTFEKEQRAAAERNAQTISRRRAIADQVTGYATYLQSNGVTDEQLQAVIASGPNAIETLTTRVQAAVEANNGRPLGSSDVAAIIRMPEGFSPVDMTTDEFIRQTYGLGVKPIERVEAAEPSFLDRLGGRDQMARAEERLTRTPFMEGMTITDINRAAQRGEYESLIPGTFVSFASDRSYNVTEEGVAFLRDFSNQLDMLSDTTNYRSVLTDLGMEGGMAAQLQMRIETVDPLIRGYAQSDPEGFMRAHEAQIRNQLGDAYVQQLREDLGLDAPEPEAEEAPTTATETATAPTPAATTSVTPSEEAEVADEEPVVEPNIPVAPPASETDVDDENQEAPEVEPPSDTRVRINDEIVTYQQWLDMSRTAREAAGLPVSFIGGQIYFRRFGVGMGTADPETGQRITEQTTEPMQTEQPEVYRSLSDQGVDDVTISLLGTHGSDMLQYLTERGITDQEAAFNALTDWGQENSIVMPFDKSALIFALMSVLNR
jgi:hypothetical protein